MTRLTHYAIELGLFICVVIYVIVRLAPIWLINRYLDLCERILTKEKASFLGLPIPHLEPPKDE